jgi:hypothetical protein
MAAATSWQNLNQDVLLRCSRLEVDWCLEPGDVGGQLQQANEPNQDSFTSTLSLPHQQPLHSI